MPCLLLEDARKPLAIRTRLRRSVPDEDERAAGGRGEGARCSSTASAAARSRLGPVCALLGCRPRLRGETAGRAGAQVTRGLHTPRRACRHVCVALCWSSSPNKPVCPRKGAWESNVPARGVTESHFPPDDRSGAPRPPAPSRGSGLGASAARRVDHAVPCPHPSGRGVAVLDRSLLSHPGLGESEAGAPTGVLDWVQRGSPGDRWAGGQGVEAGGRGWAWVSAASEAARGPEWTAPCTSPRSSSTAVRSV